MLTASDRQHILSLDFSRPASLIKLNSYLNDEEPLCYLAVREKLLSLSYLELSRIQSDIDSESTLKNLNLLTKGLLLETQDIYLVREGIFVNNTPLLIDSPFYSDTGDGYKISGIRPHAEIVYFNNFKLPYRKNDLSEEENEFLYNEAISKQFSLKDEKPGFSSKKELVYPYTKLVHKASHLWSYRMRDDYVNNYFIKLRQWVKRYEEDLVFPVVHRGVVIIRNEYRFFFLDVRDGTELSSFGLSDIKGNEYHHTYRHPHQNSYGFEFLLSGDILFSELNAKLVAVDLEDILGPKLIWEWPLVEYTICAKPVLVDNILIAGLINARGEIWMCGFNAGKGTLQWSTYIGISSFLSPVSSIYATQDNKVFIGTNHGVLVCLDSENGNIAWIRKYMPKKYSLFDYWYKDGHKDYFLTKGGSIAYDTQFIKIEDNHILYYKPRESDYLYILDSERGQLKDKILLDHAKSQLIGICSGKGIFLWRARDSKDAIELKVVELSSGKQTYAQDITGSSLKGALHLSSSELLFKINETVYFLKADDNNIICIPIKTQAKGWLSAQGESFLLIVDGWQLYCLNVFKEKYADNREGVFFDRRIAQRKKAMDILTGLLRKNNPEKTGSPISKKELLSDFATSGTLLDTLYHIVSDNVEALRHPDWKEFITGLEKIYGNGVVTYHDIEIKFSNFLSGAKIIDDTAYLNNKGYHSSEDKNKAIGKKDYRLNLNGETSLLPIRIIKGEKTPGFFLLLSHGQLLCVAESGSILWEKKLFYGPVWDSGSEKDQEKHIYAADIEAFLFKDTLIINDRINVVAIDVVSGAYIWSVTNKEGLFHEEGQFPPRSSEWDYKSRKLFVKYTMFYTRFIDDRLIILHGNKAYAVNPETGYCHKYRQLRTEGVMEAKAADKEICLLTYSLKNIEVLNKDLETIRNLSVGFLDEPKESWPEMFYVGSYLLLHLRPEIYIIDAKTGALTDTLKLAYLKRYYIEICQNSLLVIEPLRQVTKHSINNGSLMPIWEHKVDSPDLYSVWEPTGRKSRYCFYYEGRIYFFSRVKGEYFVSLIDFATGREFARKHLDSLKGPFHNLSSPMGSRGEINFVISTVYTGEIPYQTDILKAALDAFAEGTVDIDSRLIRLDAREGDIIKAEIMPSGSFAERGMSLTETENCFIYNIYGSYLRVVAK